MAADMHNIIERLGKDARHAAFTLADADGAAIDRALTFLAQSLNDQTGRILDANARDLASARDKNLTPSMIDRMTLDEGRVKAMAGSVETVRALPDPCGEILEEWTRPNGLRIQKVSVPIGVLGMIYESRPNVTIDAGCLALKSRNAIILRGGSECAETSRFLHGLVTRALNEAGLPEACVAMVPDQSRELVGAMLAASGSIDVMIPRGGKSLTSRVMDEAKMPVFAHLDGNCHVYVHDRADAAMALKIIENAKLRRTGICGAAESLLIDEEADPKIAENIVAMLLDKNVEIRGDERAQTLDSRIRPATEEDWATEYLDKTISLKFVAGVTEAVTHINRYGSHHTDAIITADDAAAEYFLKNVDSAIVVRNASTQFADGGEFGFGAEIGIGTGKLHARGPVGVRQLTTFKYRVIGQGQTRP